MNLQYFKNSTLGNTSEPRSPPPPIQCTLLIHRENSFQKARGPTRMVLLSRTTDQVQSSGYLSPQPQSPPPAPGETSILGNVGSQWRLRKLLAHHFLHPRRIMKLLPALGEWHGPNRTIQDGKALMLCF